MREEAARLGEIDGGRDGGVRRGAQEEKLRNAEAQHVVNHGGTRRQRRIEAVRDQGIDLAQSAQHRGDQQPREGAVPRRQGGHVGIVFDGVVEGPLAPQDGADEVDCYTASRGYGGHKAPEASP